MTTFSIIAGLIPVALGIGAGSGQRAAIAVTIIGGQSLCLPLTLLVVPVAYSYLAELEAALRAMVRLRPAPDGAGLRSPQARFAATWGRLRASLGRRFGSS
jgi:hypothetical protein